MPVGGQRLGAGRKVNTGHFCQPTVLKRIPVSLANEIDRFIQPLKNNGKPGFTLGPDLKQLGALTPSNLNLPLYAGRVPAGFASPADDYVEAALDLNQHLVQHPAATFFVRASGDSMILAGIHDMDILIVDRSLEPKHRDIVIAALNGELTVKRLHLEKDKVFLRPENPDYPAIEVTEEIEFVIWGVVTSVVHQYKPQP